MVNRIASRTLRVSILLALASNAGATLAQGNAAGVEEVTVTARKRPESLQAVDISLTVIDADDISGLRLRSLPEVATYSPNVSLFEDFAGAGIPTWFIRGVGLQDFNSNNTPAAGVYVDGNYQVATIMGTSMLYDVSQVEILKGPQGGLYGRNTSGGAVLVSSNRAALNSRESSLQLGYGSWDQTLAEGMINIPLGNNSAWRLAGRAENSSDGWQKTIGSDDPHGEKDRWDLRSWMTWDVGNGFSAQWKLQGGSDDSEVTLGRSVGLYRATDQSNPPNFCTPIEQGRRDDDLCINFGGNNRNLRGATPEKLSLQADDGSLVFSDPINRQQNDYVDSVLELRWRMANAELVSISAYDNFGYGINLDLDGSRGEYGHRFSTSDIEVISQELRLQSFDDDALQWMVGLSWSEEEFSEFRDFKLRENTLARLGMGQLVYDQDTTAKSAYADLSYQLSEQWGVNAAVRYTDEEKSYRNGDFYLLTNPRFYFVRDLSSEYSLDEPWSGSLGLNFTPAPTTFLYAKVSQGFKSGGFYGGFTFSPLDVTPYREETIVAWETGLKQSWPEHSLAFAAAAFLYNYQDVQGFVSQVTSATSTAFDRLTNQGDARHKGVELDIDWQPTQQIFLQAGLGWLQARFSGVTVMNTNIAGDQVRIDGDRPYAPKWSGNVIGKYVQPVGADRNLEWVMGYHYRSEFAGQQTSLIDAAVNKLPGYGVFDFSATLKNNNSSLDLSLWVKNLLDETYRTRVKSDGLNSYIEFFGEPRSVGVSALFRFTQ